jgi:predicted lipase
MTEELQAHPEYSIVTAGHSLGGALASLAAISLKSNFPNRYFLRSADEQPE